jgi:plasmid stabilization system protein ParE
MARYRIRYRLAAVDELQEAIDWYSQRDPAAGQGLRVMVREKIVAIRTDPLLYAADADGVRRAPVKRYPFHIYYRVKAAIVEILAIAHAHRQQDYWRDRL